MGPWLGVTYTGENVARKAFQAEEEIKFHVGVLTVKLLFICEGFVATRRGGILKWQRWRLHARWLLVIFTIIHASAGFPQSSDKSATAVIKQMQNL